nr:ACT domain-containing protein [uncultured Stomatobaculum sp.]
MNKVIITVLGKDMVGIIAKVCTHLAEKHINVLDINQTIVRELFHMMMIVDISTADESLEELTAAMNRIGEEMGLRIHVQREEIFEAMHRI